MTLPNALQDREYQKFVDKPAGPAVRVDVDELTGTFSPSGLRVKGKHTPVTIDDTAWYPLPPTPLANRNAVCIQNFTGFQIKVNYEEDVLLGVGYVGIRIQNQGERTYDTQDSIVVYGRAAPGSGPIVVDVEELS